MEKSLLLTLGHNSSAILVHDNKIVCGYEEERLSKVKSDSRFPVHAIYRCMQQNGSNEVDRVYATHWAPEGELKFMKAKYWAPTELEAIFKGSDKIVTSHTEDMTHHDTHAHAAVWYANGKECFTRQPTLLIVCDGFGNYGEHLSIYMVSPATHHQPRLLKRIHGYSSSLGLMYQYMTAFLGMKMHEDEYKLLGYEAHIDEVDVDLVIVEKIIHQSVDNYLAAFWKPKAAVEKRDPLMSLDALPGLQRDLMTRWLEIAKKLGISESEVTETRSRIIFAYIAQSVLEQVIGQVVKSYSYSSFAFVNLIVCGGVFYNVKLSRSLLPLVPGQICAFPLAGDQGNAIGLFNAKNNGKLKYPGHFFWGHRPNASPSGQVKGFHVTSNPMAAIQLCQDALESGEMVNVVRGAMEFGPRALCHTSTLATPNSDTVERINYANERNTVMPMAPVMSRWEYERRFSYTNRVWQSEEHMIIALPYRSMDMVAGVTGAAHVYKHEATGRPQVTDDVFMHHLLGSTREKVLINTSFNVHGHPIVYDIDQALENHLKQQEKIREIVTVYLRGDE